MVFWPIFLAIGIVIALILWKPKSKVDISSDMTAEERYMLAKQIFTRDPGAFKDKDSDGIEDELEKGP